LVASRPNLANIPTELLTTVDGPQPGLAQATGSVSKQTAIFAANAENLAVCKGRLDGLIGVVVTERALLAGAPAAADAARQRTH
jgi:hypothetical protein